MSFLRIDDSTRRALLVARHRLTPDTRTDDVVAIADDLVALHSTDPVSVYLSAAARMRTPSPAAVEHALYEQRSLLRHHAMRRTLWVASHAHTRLAHHGATLAIARVQERNLLKQLDAAGIAKPDEWFADARAAVAALLTEAGPLSAREVGARLPELTREVPIGSGRFATTQGAHSRVLLVMGFRGEVLRARPTGSWINGQYRWAAADAWTPGGIGEQDPREAAAGLARAYLRAFGPATGEDVRWWTGWTAAVTRRALQDVGAVEVALESGPGYLLPDDPLLNGGAPPDPGPSVALLPGLDPTTMGWRERDWYLPPEVAGALFDRNGNGGPAIWVDGRIVGGWAQRPDGTIATRLLVDVGTQGGTEGSLAGPSIGTQGSLAGSSLASAVDEAAHALETLLKDTRFTVRFPAPVHADLLGGGSNARKPGKRPHT